MSHQSNCQVNLNTTFQNQGKFWKVGNRDFHVKCLVKDTSVLSKTEYKCHVLYYPVQEYLSLLL